MSAYLWRFAPLCALLAAVGGSGCSTLEVQDHYVLAGESNDANMEIRDGEVGVGFEPATRFSFFGVPGLPVIPSLARPDPADEIVLSVEMMLRQYHDFAFPPSVCLEDESHVSLCSEQVLIHAVAWRRDDTAAHKDGPARSGRIEAFFDPRRPYYRVITPRQGAVRIDRETIYQFYDYQGDPGWTSFRVQILYRFRCRTQCPQKVTVGQVGLVIIDDVAAGGRKLEFHRLRRRTYRPLATQ